MKKVLKILSVGLCGTLALGAFAGFFGCGNEGKQEEEIIVCMPDGAPAMALAGMMVGDTEDDGVTYKVVDPSLIASNVTNTDEEKNADMCVLPVTAASKLLGKGDRYKMVGVVTHGNLFLISKDGEVLTAENLSDLRGKTVGVLKINEVPGLTLKAVLKKYEVPYVELVQGKNEEISAEKVNLKGISGPNDIGVVEADCFLLAEPAATAQSKNGFTIAGNLQTLYGGENGYPQAVLVAKTELLEERGEWVKSFTESVAQAADWLKTARGAEVVSAISSPLADKDYATTLKAPLLTAEVMARCGVWFEAALDSKTEITAFLSDILAVNDKAAAMPAEVFYWNFV